MVPPVSKVLPSRLILAIFSQGALSVDVNSASAED